jgi:hypothetical protein
METVEQYLARGGEITTVAAKKVKVKNTVKGFDTKFTSVSSALSGKGGRDGKTVYGQARKDRISKKHYEQQGVSKDWRHSQK